MYNIAWSGHQSNWLLAGMDSFTIQTNLFPLYKFLDFNLQEAGMASFTIQTNLFQFDKFLDFFIHNVWQGMSSLTIQTNLFQFN